MEALVNVQTLQAINAIASAEETRYYLQGVHLEVWDDRILYVATDGHRLAVAVQWRSQGGAFDKPVKQFELIMPSATIRKIEVNTKVKIENGFLGELQFAEEPRKWTIEYDHVRRRFEAIDGEFPDWRRIVPSKVDGLGATFDARYLLSFEQLGKALDAGVVAIGHNGDGPALVRYQNSFDVLGVIMPKRKTAMDDRPLPDWLNPGTAKKPKLAAVPKEEVSS